MSRLRPALRWLPGAALNGALARWLAPVLAGGLLALSGCAGSVRSVTVATGQVDTPAYQLSGPSLAHLRAEASRRCPQGFQVLRLAESAERRGAPDAGVVSRWLTRGADLVAPPEQSAQMMVLCQPMAPGEHAAAAGAATGQAGTAAARASTGPAMQPAPARAPSPALAGIELPPPSQAPVAGYQ